MLSEEDKKLLKEGDELISKYAKSRDNDLLPLMLSIWKALSEIDATSIPFDCECVNLEKILRIKVSLGNIILNNAKEIVF